MKTRPDNMSNMLFSEQDDKSRPTFPHVQVMRHTGQAILKYGRFQWLDMEDIAEAVGYAILLLVIFDMSEKKRSQLQLLLESMIFGFRAPGLKVSTVYVIETLDRAISR